jgi:hypothetical protein
MSSSGSAARAATAPAASGRPARSSCWRASRRAFASGLRRASISCSRDVCARTEPSADGRRQTADGGPGDAERADGGPAADGPQSAAVNEPITIRLRITPTTVSNPSVHLSEASWRLGNPTFGARTQRVRTVPAPLALATRVSSGLGTRAPSAVCRCRLLPTHRPEHPTRGQNLL